jgi:hypothetical protein
VPVIAHQIDRKIATRRRVPEVCKRYDIAIQSDDGEAEVLEVRLV